MWNVPFRRNPFFTGREPVFIQIEHLLHAGKTAALSQPPALSGLGGIGKTQLALEYTYQHAGDYDVVWWVRAGQPTTLAADFLTAARLSDPKTAAGASR